MRALPFLLLLLATAAVAQPPPRTLVVEGTAEVDAPPDVATVVFTVETQGRDGAETFQQHEQEVAAVLQAVRRFRIPDRDIDLQTVAFDGSSDRARAFRTIRVQTDSLRIVPDLVAAIVGAGADRVQEVGYGLRDPDRYGDAALAAAADRARAKARLLADQMDVRVGPVRAILESGIAPSGPPLQGGFLARGASVDGVRVEGGAYATGAQTVRARVVVEFDLLPATDG